MVNGSGSGEYKSGGENGDTVKGIGKSGGKAARKAFEKSESLIGGSNPDSGLKPDSGVSGKKTPIRAACANAQSGAHEYNGAARTDMALEFFKGKKNTQNKTGVKKTEVVVDEKLSARLNRPEGRYITVESRLTLTAFREGYKPLIDELSGCIRSLAEGCGSFLAVGVGNPLLTADALGARTVSLLKVNRGFKHGAAVKELSAFTPNVSGVTGIESYDFVKSVTSFVKPDCVILIDSLASAAVSRLGTAFQLCDSGLIPGSGVGGGKNSLNAKSLKVKRALSVGVPLVVYADTIIRDAIGGSDIKIDSVFKDLLVTPKDIDLLMSECAHIIAESINKALEL